jgi:phenylacetate-coenzyme A ligase PaaK-like adenylate-forming protein
LTVPVSPLEPWTAGRLGVDRLTREAIERWQVERLQEVVAWARARSPFYRDLYRSVPVRAFDSLRGSAALPLVERVALRDRGQELVCVSLGDIARVVTLPTSGSTGAPKRLWFTEEDLALTADHFRHGMRALVEPGDRVLVLMPGQAPGSVGALLREGLGWDGIEVDSYGFVDDCHSVAGRILQFGAHCLVGVPGQVVRLARSEAGRGIGRGRVKSVLLSGDHVTPAMRAAIEQAWDCSVFEHYGSTEVGLGGAVQCQAHAGLHVREADLLFEVVDPLSGEPLPDGAEGELVVSTLTRRGMPLIRYRTGDLVRMAAEPCTCGSALRCVQRVVGRRDDRAVLSGGGVLTIADLDEAVFGVEGVLGFTALLERGTSGDRLTVQVDAGGRAPDGLFADVGRRVEALPTLRGAGVETVVEALEGWGDLSPAAKQRITDLRKVG